MQTSGIAWIAAVPYLQPQHVSGILNMEIVLPIQRRLPMPMGTQYYSCAIFSNQTECLNLLPSIQTKSTGKKQN